MYVCMYAYIGSPGGSVVKNPPVSAGIVGSIPGSGRFPKSEMATHSSILAWKIAWKEKPGGLQSMGLQRYGHDLMTKQQQILEIEKKLKI